jgi:hypothetical protein
MTRQIGLLTLVCCFVLSGSALAQREVPPPSNTPLNDQPVVSQTKAAAKPVAKAPEKVKKNTLPAPVQAAAVPTTTECKPTPENKPEKATKAKAAGKKAMCPVAAKPAPKKPAAANKAKKTKSVKICKDAPKNQPKSAQAKKDSVKTAHKSTHNRVIKANTVPLE